jgi:hypothetical protein
MQIPVLKSEALRVLKLLCLTILVSAASLASAQTFYGSIVGTVSDNSGAIVPGANVTVTNLGTNEARTEKTNAAGEYSFVNLVPANYKVAVAAAGFKRFEKSPIQVAVNTATRVDPALQVGAATETVQVSTSDVPLLQTESGSLGDEVDSKQMDAMPLNGRNTMNLMELVPGVVPQGTTLTGVAMNQGTGTGSVAWGNYQIGGGMPTQSSIFIDGSPTMIMQKNSASLVPTADTIQEFQVQTSGVSPEFGRFAGGVVSMTTKSGTNQFHGTAYEYIRNKVLNANTFLNKRDGLPRPENTQNQFGGTVGGPIWKNKAFFFFAYEQIHIRALGTSSTNIPTLGMVNGTAIPEVWAGGVLKNANLSDPQKNCNITHTPGTAASPGYFTITNLYQGACGDPTTKIFAQFYPTTPKNPTTSTNWNTPYSQGDDGYQMSGRVDYDITHNQRFFARFTLWPLNDESPNIMGNANGWETSGDASHNHTNNIVTGDTITINPTTVLDIRADYLRQYGDSVPPVFGSVDESKFGAPFAAIAPYENYHNIPGFSFGGTQVHNLFGSGGNFGSWSYSGLTKMYYNNYHLSANVTKILGRHSLKFGAEVRDLNREDIGSANSGTFTFNSDIDTATATAGDEWAQFLMGEFDASSVSSAKATTTYNWYSGYYAADTWQLNKKITLSYGLRLELPGAYAVSGNNSYVLLPSAQDPVTGLTGTLILTDTSAYHPIDTIGTVSPQWEPRLGFAYRLTENTVFRGGYTLSYLPRDTQVGVFGSQMSINSTTSGNTNTAVAGAVPAYTVGINPFAYPNNNPANPEGMAVALGRNQTQNNTYFMYQNLENGTAISGPYPYEPFPHAQAINVSFGHQFKGDTLVDIGLDHELGTHLPSISRGLNQLPDQYDICGGAAYTTASQCNNQQFGNKLPSGSQLAPVQTTLGPVTLPSKLQLYGQAERPYPDYSNFSNSAAYYGTSSYNALELKVQKRFGAAGQIGGAYTWMKMITDTDSFLSSQDAGGEGVYQDYNNPKGERAIYSYDIPNRLAINYILNLPFGQGQRFAANANPALSKVISGWSLSGITSLQSGVPLHLSTSGNKLSSTFGAGTIRPNYTQDCTKTAGGSGFARSLPGATWFNTGCFTDPNSPGVTGPGNSNSFGFGNEPRTDDAIKAAGVDDFDFTVDKTTAIHEQVALKFSVEFYNLFNRVQFAIPTVVTDNSAFGQVTTGAQNFPRFIQGALRLTF